MTEYHGNFRGILNLEAIEFSQHYTKIVMKNNESSGKVTLPSELIKREVIVLVPTKKQNSKKRKKVNKI